MAKVTYKKVELFVAWLVTLLVTLGVGGFFVAGGFTNVVILNLLPLVVHQFVGWVIIIVALIGLVMSIAKQLK